jgi:hypothetical protein
MGYISSLVQFLAGHKAIASDFNYNFEQLRSGHNDQELRISNVESSYFNKDCSSPLLGNLDVNNFKIVNITDPSDAQDCSTKSYTDTTVNNKIAAICFPNYRVYSVNSGATDTNGYASFITKVDNSTVTIQATSPNLVLTYPEGSQETIISDQTVSSLADNTTTVFIKEKDNSNIIACNGVITESIAPPSGGSNGDYWLQYGVIPYKGYKKVSGSWQTCQFVKLGEATKLAGVLATPISYAFNAYYESEWFAVTTPNTSYSKNCNIGSYSPLVEFYFSLDSNGLDSARALDHYLWPDWNAAGVIPAHANILNNSKLTVNFGFAQYITFFRSTYRNSGYYKVIAKRNW